MTDFSLKYAVCLSGYMKVTNEYFTIHDSKNTYNITKVNKIMTKRLILKEPNDFSRR